MNSDSESLQHQFLDLLLTDNVKNCEQPLVECKEIDEGENLFKEAATSKSDQQKLRGTPQTFQLGEIPTVQERFQAVLKRRLQIQIQDHPPLFPWETQLTDYPDFVDESSIALVPTWVWMAQQSKLNLPLPLPERVFRQLLEQCQALLTSSVPLGAKLVQVVESFFPTESQTLNDIAGLVLRSTYRSVDALETMPNIQSEYTDLLPRQQMALSLLAAKQLLENLTLPLSSTNPVVERQWLTSVGTLNIKVECQSLGNLTKLLVQADLPTKGIMTLQGNGTLATSQSSSPESLSVELYCRQLSQTYTLEFEFPEIGEQPLLFLISSTM
ncbi:PatU [Komarekiella sp. 'clone 1']|uniref:PatU n=1 Tax=Komarekiella delphini-convector SJRDD-AB1 TaxID=2593771 RepID=A0AA40VPX7_9NOST|nr:PatU [Komarekiella delphini-convector]MBD6615747.1 PatU [Komarekiella delphini-convector SJRDD-AB1]